MTQTVLVKSVRLLDPLEPELQGRHDILVEGETTREVSDRPIAAGDAQVLLVMKAGVVEFDAL